jgi:UDP-glucose 4-epimerase
MVLVTRRAGYISSHTCIALIEAGYDVVVYDSFSNSSDKSIKRVEKIVGQSIAVVEGDIIDGDTLQRVFDDNNISGTIVLCDVMKKNGCKKIVFSSSATVYSDSSYAKEVLNWSAKYRFEKMCEDV